MKYKSQITRRMLVKGFEFNHLQLDCYRVIRFHRNKDTVDVQNSHTNKIVKDIPYKIIKLHGRLI